MKNFYHYYYCYHHYHRHHHLRGTASCSSIHWYCLRHAKNSRGSALDCKVDLSIVIYGVEANLRSGSSCLDKHILCRPIWARCSALLMLWPTGRRTSCSELRERERERERLHVQITACTKRRMFWCWSICEISRKVERACAKRALKMNWMWKKGLIYRKRIYRVLHCSFREFSITDSQNSTIIKHIYKVL